MQAENAAPSSRQRKLAVASSSVNAKLAEVEAVTVGGVDVSVGSTGGVRSIVQMRDAAGLSFPAASTAFTAKVWVPAARPV